MVGRNLEPEEVEKLVEKSKEGDTAAFDKLHKLYYDRIYNYAARMVHDQIEAEDVAQEAFVKAYRNLPKFRGASTFQTWLYRIAYNLTIDSVRRRRRRENTCSLDAPLDTEEGQMAREQEDAATPGPAHDFETAELQRVVHRAIQQLSPKLRSIVVLYELQQLSYEEIADIVGCPLGTVKSRLFNARNELKKKLEGDLPDYSGMPEVILPKPEPIVSERPVIIEVPKSRLVCEHFHLYPAFADLPWSVQKGACPFMNLEGIWIGSAAAKTGACRECPNRQMIASAPRLTVTTPECLHYQGKHSGLPIDKWAGTCSLEQASLSYEEMMLGRGICAKCSSRKCADSVFAGFRRNQFAIYQKRGEA